MPFSDTQRQALTAKLRFRHVKSRDQGGATLSYIEGWHAIAEGNRIFGFDSWDRKTLFARCLWRETQRGQTVCLYTSKVRITVRAGGCVIKRDGIGTGFGRAASPEQAHEMAHKAAETDATKRALATFGNPFGLALYDKDQAHVTRPAARGEAPGKLNVGSDLAGRNSDASPDPIDLLLHVDGAADRSFGDPDAFQTATLGAISSLASLKALYAFWEQNLDSFKRLHGGQRHPGGHADRYAAIRMALKARARALGDRAARDQSFGHTADLDHGRGGPLQTLAIPKEKRQRDKAHLAFVASQPCLVCGRSPAQAHHLKFAQSRSMSLKVSDKFTLPLYNVHHDQLHRSGDERGWWGFRTGERSCSRDNTLRPSSPATKRTQIHLTIWSSLARPTSETRADRLRLCVNYRRWYRMPTVNIFEAKSQLSRLVESVETGSETEIIIARNGRPVAALVPIRKLHGQRIGVARGEFWFLKTGGGPSPGLRPSVNARHTAHSA